MSESQQTDDASKAELIYESEMTHHQTPMYRVWMLDSGDYLAVTRHANESSDIIYNDADAALQSVVIDN